MEGHGWDRQALFLPQPADFYQIDEAFHIPFDPVQPAQSIQFGQQVLQLFRGLGSLFFGKRFRGRSGGGVWRGGGAARMAGDEGGRIGAGAITVQAVPVTEGGEGVGAGIDKAGLLVAHCPVHGGKEEEHQNHQVYEPAGGGLAVGPVVVHHFLEKGGGLEAGILGHGGAQLPKEGGGDGIALAIDGVVPLHMLGGDRAAVGLPHPEGAPTQELVRPGMEHLAHGRVGNVLPEGSHPIAVLLVHGLGRHRVLHAATSFLPPVDRQLDGFDYMTCHRPGQVCAVDIKL